MEQKGQSGMNRAFACLAAFLAASLCADVGRAQTRAILTSPPLDATPLMPDPWRADLKERLTPQGNAVIHRSVAGAIDLASFSGERPLKDLEVAFQAAKLGDSPAKLRELFPDQGFQVRSGWPEEA